MFVRKYVPEIKALWTRQFGTAEYDHALGLAVNGTNAYVTGSVAGQASLGMHDALIVRLSTAGESIWMHQFGSSNLDDAFEVSVDASGIYLAGLAGGRLPGQKNAGNVDTFATRLEAPDGAQGQ